MDLETLRSEILEIADLAIKYSHDLHVPTAEVFVIKKSVTEVKYSRGKTETRDGIVQGVAIRVAEGKKVGFATCAGFASDSIKETIENAYRIAKNRPEDPRFPGFVTESNQGEDGILDENIVSLSTEEIATQWGGYAVATTEGCLVSTLNTNHGGSAYAIVMSEGDRSTAFGFKVGRKVQDLTGIGTLAINKALKHLDSKPLGETLKVPTIWEPLSASMLLSTALTVGLNGGTVVEKRNPLMDKLDQQIASKDFQLYDDGTDPTKISTYAIDTEGIQTKKTTIIKDGVLKSFLFDNFYGPIFGTKSTGNAKRSPPIEYESAITIEPNKLILRPGTKDLEKQIEESDKAIYIEGFPMGMGHANMISGDFSVTATNAYLVENGEIKTPIKSVSISGNFFKSLMDLLYIGSDIIDLPFPLESPTLTINNHTISG
ncbi:MAG: TldD/PmbA family protein [Candidatus Heimdallarchaeaceae archaeon]